MIETTRPSSTRLEILSDDFEVRTVNPLKMNNGQIFSSTAYNSDDPDWSNSSIDLSMTSSDSS